MKQVLSVNVFNLTKHCVGIQCDITVVRFTLQQILFLLSIRRPTHNKEGILILIIRNRENTFIEFGRYVQHKKPRELTNRIGRRAIDGLK
ncbi:unnamed protein product [Acanthoscelides obtectus]|uniref:Uncharacterized protein n=1 Tax=Acanthoscelides obtectus TaxID=200917 RepID=A0A9P0L7J4_ACAOB|nr:unnamed protein product [Acanthoscelides obtectus]CAK1673109.1 hypothetical protein AOBTE_LOCUS29242 [Acanthoscelides obtectus]